MSQPYGQSGPGPQQPYQQQGYQQPYPQRTPQTPLNRLGEALGWAWNQMTANLRTWVWGLVWVGIAAVILVIAFIVYFVAIFSVADSDPSSASSDAAAGGIVLGGVAMTGGIILAILFSLIFSAAVYIHAEKIADGRPTEAGSGALLPDGTWKVLGASVVVGLLSIVATIIPVIGNLVVGFFLFWVPVVVATERCGIGEAFSRSFTLAKQNVLLTIVVWLVGSLIASIGSYLLYVGLIFSTPILALLVTFYYRLLTNRPIAPARR